MRSPSRLSAYAIHLPSLRTTPRFVGSAVSSARYASSSCAVSVSCGVESEQNGHSQSRRKSDEPRDCVRGRQPRCIQFPQPLQHSSGFAVSHTRHRSFALARDMARDSGLKSDPCAFRTRSAFCGCRGSGVASASACVSAARSRHDSMSAPCSSAACVNRSAISCCGQRLCLVHAFGGAHSQHESKWAVYNRSVYNKQLPAVKAVSARAVACRVVSRRVMTFRGDVSRVCCLLTQVRMELAQEIERELDALMKHGHGDAAAAAAGDGAVAPTAAAAAVPATVSGEAIITGGAATADDAVGSLPPAPSS